ncbi:MAG: MotA/TolQ/ExbB proton channel family protein [Pseudomonadota bacterium]
MTSLSPLLHALVDGLLWPVIAILLLLTVIIIIDLGMAIGERFGGLEKAKSTGLKRFEKRARQRIARVDIIARISPILGLMGTLIPLGPGIAAMGNGDFVMLASAITTAFDTTVLGLFVGILAMLIGRYRRMIYDAALDQMEAQDA